MIPASSGKATPGARHTSTLVDLLSKPRIVILAVLAMLMLVARSDEDGAGADVHMGSSRWHGRQPELQQISDSTFTHVLHGIGFYALIFLVGRRLPVPVRCSPFCSRRRGRSSRTRHS